MSYIMDLRKVVGHRPLLRVGASVIVVDEDDRILLQLRTDLPDNIFKPNLLAIEEYVSKQKKTATIL